MKKGFVFVGFLFLVIFFLGSVSAACSWDETWCTDNNKGICWNICNTCWANICWDKEKQ